ncbi:MAG: FAD-dependent monooxygenase [Chitinophagaceae bacterium]|nr:FAD-dependent monooxygenase [Chitinophagaceae bacterium]
MKAVIIGGGIAGLTLAAWLAQQDDWDIHIYERNEPIKAKGHAFLIHPAAAALIHRLPGVINHVNRGEKINTYHLFDTQQHVLFQEPLEDWLCMRRSDLLLYLESLLADVNIVYNKRFESFKESDGRYTHAIFDDGESVAADVFFGCDGVHSPVRKTILGEVQFSEVQVKEIVSVVKSNELAQKYRGQFSKFVHPTQALALGFIPCNENELVWFMQFDVRLQKEELNNPQAIQNHCKQVLAEFPEDVQTLMALNNFEYSYVWHSTDFNLLPAFHKQNVVLLGDAAHVALPFTSAGVANALTDSAIVASLLQKNNNNFHAAFTQYYEARAEELQGHITQGRELQQAFLNTEQVKKMIPLIQVLESPDTI